MSTPSSAKRKFIVMVSVLSLVLVTIVLWSVQAYRQPGASLMESSLQVVILLTVFAFMISFLIRMSGDIRHGLPLEDERSQKIKVLAGYYAFMVSIYLWLGIMFFEDHFTVSSACGAAILGATITFGLAYVYFSRKPKVN